MFHSFTEAWHHSGKTVMNYINVNLLLREGTKFEDSVKLLSDKNQNPESYEFE